MRLVVAEFDPKQAADVERCRESHLIANRLGHSNRTIEQLTTRHDVAASQGLVGSICEHQCERTARRSRLSRSTASINTAL